MTDVLFKKVDFNDAVDPVRIEYTWWEDLPPARPTTFGLWITSMDDDRRRALLAVQRDTHGALTSYAYDVSTGQRNPVGTVTHSSPGCLIAEFPRDVISDYGPAVRWWAFASVGENDVDRYFDEDADTRILVP